MLRRLWLVLVGCLALLSGCLTAPGSFDDVHTGRKGYLSGRAIAAVDMSSTVYAIAAYSQTSDEFAIFTEYRTHEGLYVYLKEAWSFGDEIPYTHLDRLKLSCSTGCVAVERGRLRMTRDAFEKAAREGLEFRLVGRRASPLCKLPPEMFEQVLMQMRGHAPKAAPAAPEFGEASTSVALPASGSGRQGPQTQTRSTRAPIPVSSS